MRRPIVVLALVSAALAGCSSVKWNRYDPTTPETAAGQVAAEQARATAEAVCGPQGRVTQRDDTDGRNRADWTCERPKR